jgi:hypothetical protein
MLLDRRHRLVWADNSMARIATSYLSIVYGYMALTFGYRLEKPKQMDTRLGDTVELAASCLLVEIDMDTIAESESREPVKTKLTRFITDSRYEAHWTRNTFVCGSLLVCTGKTLQARCPQIILIKQRKRQFKYVYPHAHTELSSF